MLQSSNIISRFTNIYVLHVLADEIYFMFTSLTIRKCLPYENKTYCSFGIDHTDM